MDQRVLCSGSDCTRRMSEHSSHWLSPRFALDRLVLLRQFWTLSLCHVYHSSKLTNIRSLLAGSPYYTGFRRHRSIHLRINAHTERARQRKEYGRYICKVRCYFSHLVILLNLQPLIVSRRKYRDGTSGILAAFVALWCVFFCISGRMNLKRDTQYTFKWKTWTKV